MTRRLLLTLTLAATAACAPVAAADAAKRPAPYPTVSKVEPLVLGIGDTLRINGKNFTAGKNKNTVVFKRDGKKAVFVKAYSATKGSLAVVVPEKLLGAMGKKDGAEVPTRFRLRVLSKRFAKSYTALKGSPTIAPKGKALLTEEAKKVEAALPLLAAAAATPPAAPSSPPPPPDCDGDGNPDATDAHDDLDGLSDAFEAEIKTNRCATDSDGDGLEDGWEHKSAFDLNRESCPSSRPYPTPCEGIAPAKYPVKKPYPNPLDGGDGGTDFDGDLISAWHEHRAWQRKVGTVRNFAQPLWYSDGLQASIDDGHSLDCRGMEVPPPLGNPAWSGHEYRLYSLDRFGRDSYDGCLNDGERDEDGDWLSNSVELIGSLSATRYWEGNFKEPLYKVVYEGTDWLDGDTDGDGTIDAKDDQDHDDFWNIEEMTRGPGSRVKGVTIGSTYGLWVEPFNPCLPSWRSRTCPPSILFEGAPWRPFFKETEPEDRWPLYGDNATAGAIYAGERWLGMPDSAQTMPPPHPLPRCTGAAPPAC